MRTIVLRCLLAAGVVAGATALAACQSALGDESGAAGLTTPAPSFTALAPATTTPAAAPPTTTRQAPTTTVTVTVAQTKYFDACQAPQNQTPVEPTKLFFGCDGSIMFENAHWTSWTNTQASATGTLSVNDCTPSCANGTYHPFPVVVRLSQPQRLSCGVYYTDATVTFDGPPPSGLGTTQVDGHAFYQVISGASDPSGACTKS